MKQVLLVDDDPSQLAVRQLLLNRGGIESQLATEARQALALLKSDAGRATIGLVVTDHLMPEMNGADFVREIRSSFPNLPVIVISGLPEAHNAYDGLEVLFLAKPCEPEDLIAMVRNALLPASDRSSFASS
jgi:DNA-binding NtrC family response regulator